MKSEQREESAALPSDDTIESATVPAGVDRRTFLMRSAVIGAASVITGRSLSAAEQTARASAAAPPLGATMSSDLDVVKRSKGPVMTVIEEFYKVGPGPSSSHTIGPMRITYDFYQRCTKLPADELAQATGLKVHLFGSLSATGKGHGTERAALAGLIGKEPATVEPEFLDSLASNPNQTFEVKLGDKTHTVSLQDIIYDSTKGNFPHPNTMTCKLVAGDKVLYEQEYYSVGGGFIEWKGYQSPQSAAAENSRWHVGCCGLRLSLQAQCNAFRSRRRMSSRNRCGLRDGRSVPRRRTTSRLRSSRMPQSHRSNIISA